MEKQPKVKMSRKERELRSLCALLKTLENLKMLELEKQQTWEKMASPVPEAAVPTCETA